MEYISYNMGTPDFPDIYARALGPAALGLGHIYQANPSCPWYNYYIYIYIINSWLHKPSYSVTRIVSHALLHTYIHCVTLCYTHCHTCSPTAQTAVCSYCSKKSKQYHIERMFGGGKLWRISALFAFLIVHQNFGGQICQSFPPPNIHSIWYSRKPRG